MPYINVKVKGRLTKEQKEKIAEDMSIVLESVAGKPRAHTYVVIDEVSGENWAVGGKLLG